MLTLLLSSRHGTCAAMIYSALRCSPCLLACTSTACRSMKGSFTWFSSTATVYLRQSACCCAAASRLRLVPAASVGAFMLMLLLPLAL